VLFAFMYGWPSCTVNTLVLFAFWCWAQIGIGIAATVFAFHFCVWRHPAPTGGTQQHKAWHLRPIPLFCILFLASSFLHTPGTLSPAPLYTCAFALFGFSFLTLLLLYSCILLSNSRSPVSGSLSSLSPELRKELEVSPPKAKSLSLYPSLRQYHLRTCTTHVQCNTAQHSAALFSISQHSTVRYCNSVQCTTAPLPPHLCAVVQAQLGAFEATLESVSLRPHRPRGENTPPQKVKKFSPQGCVIPTEYHSPSRVS